MVKNDKLFSSIFFGLIFTIIILTFSIGKSSLESQIDKYKRYNPENNKVINFGKTEGFTTSDLFTILDKENITVMTEKTLIESGIMIRTYPLTNGLYYKDDVKEGKYFDKGDYTTKSNEVIISSSVKDEELNQEYIDENGELKRIKLNKVGETYSTFREIIMPIPLYEKIGGKIDISDPTQVVVLSAKDESTLNEVIKNIEEKVNKANKDNELLVFNYMPYNVINEQKSMENILLILFIITIINTIAISGMLVNKRRKEIVIRKIVGASNFRIAGVFFGELFIIGVISMVLAVFIQGILSIIFNGYILNIKISLSATNFYSSILVTLGMTLITTIPFMFYISRIQPIEETRGNE
ncbi:MAG: ABC transporter permease [Clostridium sp.]